MRVLWIVGLLVLSLVGCMGGDKGGVKSGGSNAKGSSIPDWTLTPPRRDHLIYGVGSSEVFASDRDLAAKQGKSLAIAAISEQIEVTVESTSVAKRQKISSSEASTRFLRDFSQMVRSRAPEITYTQIREIDTYYDRDNSQLYLLMGLDVAAEINGLEQKRMTLDEQLERTNLQPATDSLQLWDNIRSITRWMLLVEERIGVQQRINQLDSQRNAELLPESIKQKQALWHRELARMQVAVLYKNKAGEQLAVQLSQKLTEAGLTVVEKDQAVLRVLTDINFVEQKDKGVYYQFARGRYQLFDALDRVIAESESKAKGSSGNAELAQQRAIDKLAGELSQGIYRAILE